MRKTIFALPVVLALLLLVLGQSRPSRAASEPGYVQSSDQVEQYRDDILTPEELDDLLAPIALYPDPLIAQILPAATFVDQVQEAASFVRRYGVTTRIDDQPWDLSVKAVAHYPTVLYMMDERIEWTTALGQAFIDQQQEVMDAIQRLRLEAREQGNLYSTPEQQVNYEDDVVSIVPASPEYVYVPVYDPQVVYVERYNPAFPVITFGTGLFIGAWLSRDCDWRHRRVYYHGWRGRGWVDRARPHIHDRRGVYVNRRAAVVTVNERVMQRDTRRFRRELREETVRRNEMRGGTAAPGWKRPYPARGEQVPGRAERRGQERIERTRPERIERQRQERMDRQRPGRGGRSERSEQRQGVVRQPAPAVAVPTPTAPRAPAATTAPPAGGASGRAAGSSVSSPASVQPVTPSETVPQRQRGRPESRPSRWEQFREHPTATTPAPSRHAPRPAVTPGSSVPAPAAPATSRPSPAPAPTQVTVPSPAPPATTAPRSRPARRQTVIPEQMPPAATAPRPVVVPSRRPAATAAPQPAVIPRPAVPSSRPVVVTPPRATVSPPSRPAPTREMRPAPSAPRGGGPASGFRSGSDRPRR